MPEMDVTYELRQRRELHRLMLEALGDLEKDSVGEEWPQLLEASRRMRDFDADWRARAKPADSSATPKEHCETDEICVLFPSRLLDAPAIYSGPQRNPIIGEILRRLADLEYFCIDIAMTWNGGEAWFLRTQRSAAECRQAAEMIIRGEAKNVDFPLRDSDRCA